MVSQFGHDGINARAQGALTLDDAGDFGVEGNNVDRLLRAGRLHPG